MNVTNSNQTIDLPLAVAYVQKSSIQIAKQINTNYLGNDILQLAANQNILALYDIKNLDENTKEVLLNIKDVLTSCKHFRKLCELKNQQLAAMHLSNLLTEQYTVTIRKWILPPYLNYFDGYDTKTFFASPLIHAVKCNNAPIAKVIIKNLIKTSDTCYCKYIDWYYNLRNAANLYFPACKIILENSCIDNTYNEQKYSMEKFIFDYLMPILKHQLDSESYLEKAYFILIRTQSAEVFKLIHQEIISSNQEVVKDELNEAIYMNFIKYHNRHNNSPNHIDKMHYFLTKTNLFKKSGGDKKQYLFDLLALKKYSIAKEIIEQAPKNILTTTNSNLWLRSSNQRDNNISVFYMAIKFLDIETIIFLLNVADLTFLIDNTDAFNYAILNDKKTVATVLRTLKFNYKYKFNLTPDQRNKIQESTCKLFRLSKLSAITLGIKYIQQQTNTDQIKKEISVFNPYLAAKITKVKDVFTAYYTHG